MKKIIKLSLIFLTLFLNINIFASTLYVDLSATGTATGESWTNAFTTITEAITTANANDEIHIAAGTYTEGTTIIISKNLIIQGGYPVGGGTQDITINKTILDGENSYQILYNLSEITLNGLVIQNGNSINNGGGIYNSKTLTINNCIINNNFSSTNGGGVINISSDAIITITNSTIKNNTSNYGGGIANSLGTLNITNTSIESNIGSKSGGGIHNHGVLNLNNSIITQNIASSLFGGGIYHSFNTATITNSIISNNSSFYYGDGIINGVNSLIDLKNSILYNNNDSEYHNNSTDANSITFEYSLIKGENPTGTGNIDATDANFDPMFIDLNNNNYNLKYRSPLIDTGLNSFNTEISDIIGNTRINNTTIDIGPYEYNNDFTIWTGATDNDWNTNSNWDTNTLPLVTSDVIIPSNLTNYPTANTVITFNSLIIESGATFIPESTVNGTITHKKNIPDTNWHFITPTVIGETYENIIENHSFATGTGNNIGLSTYLNSGSTPWIYFSNTATGTLYRSIGYAVKLQSASTISFTGTISGIPNRSANVGSRNGFILTGNPHTAYIDANQFLNYNSDALAENSIWIWNGSEYVTYNHINSIQIEPVEGFFVEAASTSGISFPNSNRSHQTSSSSKQEIIPFIKLFVENDDNKKDTKIFYMDGKTTDFDNGYDSKIYGGTDYNFAVFTELVNNNLGNKLAIQTLPVDYTSVIPVGIIADADKEITFSIAAVNLPEEVEVYLEDKKNGVLTNLTETNYKTTLNEVATGAGQFYLHTTTNSLSIDKVNSENINIYKSSNTQITITGLNTSADINIYSLLGKKILETKKNANGIHKINLPALSTGVYIVKVTSENNEITKKITLN